MRITNTAREAVLGVVVRMPRLHRMARLVARWGAARHRVAAVAVVVDDGAVLLVEHAFRDDRWGLPGGWVHRHEDPHRAAEREVLEELGIDVAAVAVVHGERQGNGRDGPAAVTFAFRCRLAGSGRPAWQLSNELGAARSVPLAEAVTMVTRFEAAAIERAVSPAM